MSRGQQCGADKCSATTIAVMGPYYVVVAAATGWKKETTALATPARVHTPARPATLSSLSLSSVTHTQTHTCTTILLLLLLLCYIELATLIYY